MEHGEKLVNDIDPPHLVDRLRTEDSEALGPSSGARQATGIRPISGKAGQARCMARRIRLEIEPFRAARIYRGGGL